MHKHIKVMYIKIKKGKSAKFVDAMSKQMIYTEYVDHLESDSAYIMFIDCATPREVFYVGRWVGRNCSTDEIIIQEKYEKKVGQR